MSTTIDQRVVEMRFDNKHFEQNVSNTMSTLDKLKQKLHLDGASKGLENVNAAAKKVDMNGLGSGVEAVRMKFSALEVMGVTALANITNSAVNAGKRIVSALTIDPIKTGFQEYETQINAVQTILANTESKGTTIDDVNAALEQLNAYADKTIYNFTEMTRNIGTFTAAGVDLDTSVNAIQGIANLAAVSGSTSQQASTAMYQLSQALAAGTVKLMDWNSVVNAGMGGEVFQNALKETARVHGVAIDSMIKEQGSFRETLSEGWLTSEILTETLQKFTLATEGLTKEQIEANREMLRAKGYTEAQIDEIFKLGDTATNAATKVKTFTQLWDVLKEAAQSGWSKTWKLLIGDFEQAKSLLTPLADFLTGIINNMSDFRNNIIEGAMGSPFGKLAEKIKTVTGATEEMKNVTKDYSNIVKKVIGGEYGRGQSRWDKLAKEGYDWAKVQNLVNKELGDSTRHTEQLADAQGKQSETQAKTIEQLVSMSDAQLKNLKFTDSEIKALRELEEQSKKTGIPIEDLVKDMDQLSGRSLMINTFKNAGQALLKVLEQFKGAWDDVFPPKSTEERSKQLYDIIAALHKFSTKLIMTDDTADKLRRTLKGVFAAIDIVATVAGGAFKVAFKVLTEVLSYFDMDILDLTASIGDVVVKFRDWFDSLLDVSKVLDLVVPYIKIAVDTVGKFFTEVKKSDVVKQLASHLDKASKAVREWIDGFSDADSIPEDIIAGLTNGLKDGASKVWNAAVEMVKTLVDKVKGFLGIHSPSTVFMAIGGFIVAGLILGLQNGAPAIWDTLTGIVNTVIGWIKSADFGTILGVGISASMLIIIKKMYDIFETLAAPMEGLGDMFEDIGTGAKRMLTGMRDMFQGIGKSFKAKAWKSRADALKSFAIAIAILAGSVFLLAQLDTGKLWGAIGAITALAAVIGVLAIAIGKLGPKESLELGKFALALLGISGSLLIVATALEKVSNIRGEKLLQGGAAILALGGIITGLIAATKLADKEIYRIGSILIKMSVAMLLLVYIGKILSGMSWEELAKAGIGILGLGAIVTGLVAMTKLAGKDIDKVGSMLLKTATAMLLLVFVAKIVAGMEWPDIGKAGIIIGALEGLITGLVAATRLAGGKDLKKVGSTLLSMAAAMLILSFVGKIVSGMSWDELGKAGIAISGLAVIISGLVAATRLAGGNELKRVGTTLMMMSISIGILAAVSVLLGMIKTENLIKGVAAVAVLGTIVSMMIWATKGATDCKGNIIAISIAIGAMAVAIAALSMIDAAKLAGASAALSLVTGAFAAVVYASKSAAGVKIGALLTMILAVGLLAGIIALLAQMDAQLALESSAGLSLLLVSLSGSMALLSKASGVTAKAIVPAMLMGVVISELAGILWAMSELYVANTLANSTALSILLTSLAGSMAILSRAAGVTAMAVVPAMLMGVVVGELAAVLWAMKEFDVAPNLETAAALSVLLLALSAACVILAPVGPIAAQAVLGAVALAGVVAVLGALVLSVGWLTGLMSDDTYAQITLGLDRCIEVFEKVGLMLGSLAGGFIGGIGEGVLAGLPGMATSLSDFMTNLKPFLDGANGITEETMAGVRALAETILILTQANILDGLTSWFTGGSSITTFGSQLAQLGSDLNAFATNLGTFDESKVTTISCAAAAIKTLAQAADAIPNSGGWAAKLFGENSIAAFSMQLPVVGGCLNAFATNLGTFDESKVNTVTCAANAIKCMAEAADAIPNSGGWAEKLLGDNSLATFGTQLPALGTNLNSFATNLGTFDDAKVATITCAANAIKAMAQAAEGINGQAEWAKKLFGDNSLATFGTQLASLGTNLKAFADNLGTFDDSKVATVTCAVKAVKALTGLANADLKGAKKHLADFGTEIVTFASDLSAFCSDMPATETITTAVDNVKKILSMIQTIATTDGIDANFTKSLKDLGSKGVDTFVEAFAGDSARSEVKGAAKDLMEEAISGVEDKSGDFKGAFEDAAKDGVDGINGQYQNFYDAGSYLVDGFSSGISANSFKAAAQAAAMAEAAKNAAKNALKINSPSKVFRAIGTSVPEGFAMGIDKLRSMVTGSSVSMADAAIGTVSKSIARIADVMNTDIDSQPTIRPVLDLSDVESGATTISDMLRLYPSVGVMANVGSISSMMNNRQNGANNDDVVSAINKLRKDIGNISGDSYSVGNITYDDGSNISDAVRTIARAIKIGRRT